MIVGEWSAFPSKSFTNDLIRHTIEKLSEESCIVRICAEAAGDLTVTIAQSLR